MKATLSIILISATLATIIWGGFMMYSENGHTHCPISALESKGCMNAMSPLMSALAHLNVVIGISTGVAVWPLLLLSLMLAFGAFLSFAKENINLPANVLSARRLSYEANRDYSQSKWLGWLSVLEKRDPSVFRAAKA